jgi:hypothetical protein
VITGYFIYSWKYLRPRPTKYFTRFHCPTGLFKWISVNILHSAAVLWCEHFDHLPLPAWKLANKKKKHKKGGLITVEVEIRVIY